MPSESADRKIIYPSVFRRIPPTNPPRFILLGRACLHARIRNVVRAVVAIKIHVIIRIFGIGESDYQALKIRHSFLFRNDVHADGRFIADLIKIYGLIKTNPSAGIYRRFKPRTQIGKSKLLAVAFVDGVRIVIGYRNQVLIYLKRFFAYVDNFTVRFNGVNHVILTRNVQRILVLYESFSVGIAQRRACLYLLSVHLDRHFRHDETAAVSIRGIKFLRVNNFYRLLVSDK